MSTAYSVCAYTHKIQTGRYNRNFQRESCLGFTSYENIQTQRFDKHKKYTKYINKHCKRNMIDTVKYID